MAQVREVSEALFLSVVGAAGAAAAEVEDPTTEGFLEAELCDDEIGRG